MPVATYSQLIVRTIQLLPFGGDKSSLAVRKCQQLGGEETVTINV